MMFFGVHVDYDVLSEVIIDQKIFQVIHVDYDVLSKVILDRRYILRRPRVLRRRLRGQS